ncbi:MAG: 50S ribosomal protein L9, partial [Nitrospirae bacterium]|nr:50S ribosomal protein L9 [Nitrospirota bacterium]
AKKSRKSAEDLAGKLSGVILTIEAQAGEGDKLFGSVTNMDVSDALTKQGYDIDKRKIVMPDEPIKRLGSYNLQYKLHPELTVNINLEVKKSEQ